jgi:NADPH-dependent 2,4-dienoyl-CoA reductase/sulfur reductase-like enzyme
MNYVIVGTGPAGVIAAETLRQADPSGGITLIGDEPGPPYSRMAIPYLLAEEIGEEGTHLRHGPGHYENLGIELRNARVSKVSPSDGTLGLEEGGTVGFDKLLIATGSRAVRPPVSGMDLPGVENCWTLADARKIAAQTKPGSRVVLLGAGFIGCIVLEALVARKVELTVIEMADRMVPRMMDHTGGDMIKRWCQSKGVEVLTSTQVTGIEAAGGALRLSLGSGGPVEADFVVCATGVQPNIAFLDGSGIETDAGILVDRHLQSNQPGVYAAGDVAQGPDFSTGRQEIHAIQPTAVEQGRVAALNMAGRETAYGGSLSMNVLNTLGLISSSFGLWMGVDGGDEVEAVDAERYRYLRLAFEDDVVVGALALGLTQHVGVVRGLVQSRVRVGAWKDRLMRDPHQVMEAYLACTQDTAVAAE